MQNLEQIRARNALVATDSRNSKPVKKEGVDRLPAMIVNNGLLAAAAFAEGKSKQSPELKIAMDAIVQHLLDPEIARLQGARNTKGTKGMIEELSGKTSTSAALRLATNEALAYLAYLKRFAVKSEKKGREED
ncbi:MAG: type III-B CRISPR module-associated protein Cmr5 [Acidobacteria bacterium]|nr:type III-B CRISPR module-associated protein Cmr5 [Acidobacteriota bacterium]